MARASTSLPVCLMPVGYCLVSRTQWTVRPVVVVVLLIRSTITWWVFNGRPRQFMVIWENSRCSIRFHFEVPGVILSRLFDHGCDLGGYVMDSAANVVDVSARPC